MNVQLQGRNGMWERFGKGSCSHHDSQELERDERSWAGTYTPVGHVLSPTSNQAQLLIVSHNLVIFPKLHF